MLPEEREHDRWTVRVLKTKGRGAISSANHAMPTTANMMTDSAPSLAVLIKIPPALFDG